MMLHPELLRAARTAPRPLLRATALLTAVTAGHIAQAGLLAVTLADIARGRTDRLPVLLGAVVGVLLLRALLTCGSGSPPPTPEPGSAPGCATN
jgi:hypothetical protein